MIKDRWCKWLWVGVAEHFTFIGDITDVVIVVFRFTLSQFHPLRNGSPILSLAGEKGTPNLLMKFWS